MPKGRRPLPTAVKKLRGNPGKRKLSKDEPTPAAVDPVMPPGLSEAAQAEWKDILPILRDMKVLTAADAKALAGYCHNFARWMEAEEEVKRLGIIIEEPIMGGPADDREVVGYKYKNNPALRTSMDAQRQMKSFLVEFGMTPASRTRIRIEKPAEPDPFEDYLAGKSVGNVPSTQPN